MAIRDIIFRGKRIDNGEWVEGFYYAIPENYGSPPNPMHMITAVDCNHDWEVDPDTVGQYTGLKDKNGRRIFEGDIIQLSYTGSNRGVEGKAAVVFENGMFGVVWGWHKELVRLDGFANTTLEIIGNVHDNPEMIGGKDA